MNFQASALGTRRAVTHCIMDHHCKSQDRQRWARFAPVAVMLAVGLAFSVTAFIVVRHLENARLEGAFQQRAGAIAASLKRSVDISLDDVYSLADFLAVSRDVIRDAWRGRARGRRRARSHEPPG